MQVFFALPQLKKKRMARICHEHFISRFFIVEVWGYLQTEVRRIAIIIILQIYFIDQILEIVTNRGYVELIPTAVF